MDERFIKWLNLYDEFSEGTALRDIMNDAIRCYRHGIARPSLMLSYIAFIQAVKDNLLKSDMPKGFNASKWEACMKRLRIDNQWDEQVITCIKYRDNPAYFELSDSIREDVCYWRNRRNDCAHYKDSEITLSHVSAFWVFMMDNYNKFTPLGSLTQCINEYKRHYNISLTPRGTSTKKIFDRLCLAIKTEEDLLNFLKETFDVMQFDNQCSFLHELLANKRHRQKVIKILKDNMKGLRMYLQFMPTDVSLILGDDATLTRKFWYDDFCLFGNCVNVYIEMLRAGMLPKPEIKESLVLLLEKEYARRSFLIYRDEDFRVLLDNGLYDIFIDNYLEKKIICSNPSEKCQKTDFYISIIQKGGITDKLIKVLSNSITGAFPYTLRDRLKKEVFMKAENHQRYIEAIDRLEINDFLNIKEK